MVSNVWDQKKSRDNSVKYIDLYCSLTAEDEMGGGGHSRQNEASLWLGTAGLRWAGWGGGGEFSNAAPSDLTLLKIIV